MLYSIVKEKGCLRLFKLSTARKYIWLHVPLEVNIIVIYLLKSLTCRRCLPGSAPSEDLDIQVPETVFSNAVGNSKFVPCHIKTSL